ncbi:hypothetical protein CVIRNUC_006048 [Coccomyxa viridis]|uniref:Extracellular protein n=1 Tax=Coccomyxa viridis TaxID=1274662 RepID=A0AAV1I676_9CHLO|nr:hypothetical protein CVIRNUC_006048 [Coccomyxa viridis]
MARLASSAAAVAALAVIAAVLAPANAQQQDLVASARQANVINVQFFADANFQQVKTPFAYYNFPAISAGSCSACEDFPDAPIQWGSAVIAYSPTGGEAFQMYAGAKCTGEVFNTGASAPTMPPNFPVSSFKICRSAARK